MDESASDGTHGARSGNGNPTRREFTLEAALALLAGVTITVTGCGGDSPMAPGGGGGGGGGNPNDIVGVIATNHGHTVRITEAQLNAGSAVTLLLTIGDGHTHTVDVSQADLTALNNGQAVNKTSTVDDAHDHGVTFTP